MYKIEEESIKKIVEIYNALNTLEIRGISSVSIVYNSMIKLQEIIKEIDQNGIVIDNTKKGG